MTKTSVKAQNEMTNLGLSEINVSFLMELNLLFEWTIKFFLTLHWTQSSSKRAIWDHPDPATEGPLLYKLLKADFVVRGGKDCLSFSWCLRHCFRWSHFFTYLLLALTWPLCIHLHIHDNFTRVLVIWLWEWREGMKQSCACSLICFYGVFFSSTSFFLEPWIGSWHFWEKATVSSKQSSY